MKRGALHEPRSLFVADFIGETNTFAASIAQNGGARIGDLVLQCDDHALSLGADATVVIRPMTSCCMDRYLDQLAAVGSNLIEVRIDEMEFPGSFWRTRLQVQNLSADFFVNAQRHQLRE